MWKLDLHGLHAAEAVQALQERLQKIEMQRPMNCSVSPKKVKSKNGMVGTASLESFGCMDMEVVDKQRSSLRQIQKSLQVITGMFFHFMNDRCLWTTNVHALLLLSKLLLFVLHLLSAFYSCLEDSFTHLLYFLLQALAIIAGDRLHCQQQLKIFSVKAGDSLFPFLSFICFINFLIHK